MTQTVKYFAPPNKSHYYLTMKIIKSLPLYLCLILISSTAFAQMYKWVDEEGNISYSDQPPYKGAEQLDTPPLATMPATKIPKKNKPSAATEEAEKETVYTALKITSPQDDMTIRNNAGNFSISVSITPSLNTAQGHTISLSMDAKVIKGRSSSTSFNLTNIDRGTHKFKVSVLDKKGKSLFKSKPITVHLFRQVPLRMQAR